MHTINLANPQVAELSAVKRALLEKRLRGVSKPPPAMGISRRNPGDPAPLSFAQERLWFIQQREPDSCAHNLPCALRISGPLDVAALKRALHAVVERHEVLRTTIRNGVVRPVQVVQPSLAIPLPIVDLQAYAMTEREAFLQLFMNRESCRPFDLEQGPLQRCALFRVAEHEHVFLTVNHCIISDGWSLGVFFKDLEHYYHAFTNNAAPSLPPLQIQFADFAAWQQQQTRPEEAHARFWKEKLQNAPAAIDFPAVHSRPSRPLFKGAHFSFTLPEPVCELMLDFNRDIGITVFMLLMTGLTMVLSKWSKQKDLVLGTAVACRTRREIENLIGCFMNFLPVRASLNGVSTGLDLLRQMRATILEAQTHQDYPFEKIIDAVQPSRALDRNPLFNVALLLQTLPARVLNAGGIRSSFMPVHTDTSLLDLRFVATQADRQLSITCEYDLELFDRATIHNVMDSYRGVLHQLVKAPQTPLEDFAITAALGTAQNLEGKQ